MNLFESLRNLTWDKISSISLTISVVIGLITYIRSVKMNKMDFYFRIKNDFTSENTRHFCDSIWGKTITLEIREKRPFLRHKVNENGVDVVKDLTIDILDGIEDLNIFYEEGLIPMKLVYEGFGSFIVLTYECKEVKQFITELRKVDGDFDYYTGNKKIYDKVKSYQSNQSKWYRKLLNKIGF